MQQHGFVIIDVLDTNEVAYLNSMCGHYLKCNDSDFVSSSHYLNQEDSIIINKALHELLLPKINKQFPDLELLGGTLATKYKGNAVLKAHNDWTIVDESNYNSYNIWLPLVATNSENGTLCLIPASHKWAQAYRGYAIPNYYDTYTQKFLPIGYEPQLRAGQAIIYNHRLIHYSKPNTTNIPRNVAIIGLKDKRATLRVAINVNNNISTYEVTQNDFYNFNADTIIANHKLIETSVLPTIPNWNKIAEQYNTHIPEGFEHTSIKIPFYQKLLHSFIK